MPRASLGAQAMSNAERQARYRAARAAGTPLLHYHRPADRRSRARQWADSVATLVALQADYAAWLERLPANLQDSATGEALQAVVDVDLSELLAVTPPRGFGRD
jgi:hypothetical protein